MAKVLRLSDSMSSKKAMANKITQNCSEQQVQGLQNTVHCDHSDGSGQLANPQKPKKDGAHRQSDPDMVETG